MSEFKSMNVRLLIHIYIQKKFLFFSWYEFIGHWVTNVFAVLDDCADLKMICNLDLHGCPPPFSSVDPRLVLPNLAEVMFTHNVLSDEIGAQYVYLPMYVIHNRKIIYVPEALSKKGNGRIIFKTQQIIPVL